LIGNWLQSFPSSLTNENDFFNNGNNEIKVKTMAVTKKFNYTFSEVLDSELLEMQYIGNNISFLIILPKNKNGLNNLKSTLNATNLKSATQLMDNRVAEVYLPKFKVEQKFELMSEFKKFSEFETFLSEPDLSLINGENDLKVSQILHKVVIDVDENGTEAAAATGVVITKRTANMIVDPVVFRVDHPFIYLIRDNRNDVILFLGQINDLALK
jgi:serpin B